MERIADALATAGIGDSGVGAISVAGHLKDMTANLGKV